MPQLIIGYGNTLRADDAFGVDAAILLHDKQLPHTRVLNVFQLTPEMALECLEYSHIIFIDTAFSLSNGYALACSLENSRSLTLSHHISAFHLMDIINILYKHTPSFEIFSMLGENFETISNLNAYKEALNATVDFLAANAFKKL